MKMHQQSAGISKLTKVSTQKSPGRQTQKSAGHPDDNYPEPKVSESNKSLAVTSRVSRRKTNSMSQQDQPPTNLQLLTAENKQLRGQIGILREHWQAEVEEMQRKDAQRNLEEMTLRAEIQHLKHARRERERAGLDDLETELFIKTQDTYRWQIQVQEMQNLKLFLADDSPNPTPLEGKVIQRALDTIGTELKSVLYGCNLTNTPQRPDFRCDDDLDLLLKDFFPQASDWVKRRKELVTQMAKWGLPIVVRGLITAALRDWVFVSDFPNVTKNGDPRLLEEYRNIIKSFDGWQRLRNLEMAAYHSLTETAQFRQYLLPRRASNLSDRLSIALRPLFVLPGDLGVSEKFASWGQGRDAWESRRFSTKKIFETALQLKVATVLTNERYEFALHPLRSANKPPVENDQDVAIPVARHDNFSKVWLHASFMIYRGRCSTPPDRMADALVHTKNFLTASERETRDLLGTHKLMVKEICEGNGHTRVVPENVPSLPTPLASTSQTTIRVPSRLKQLNVSSGAVEDSTTRKRRQNAIENSDIVSSTEPSSKRRALKKNNNRQSQHPDIQEKFDKNDSDYQQEEVEVGVAGASSRKRGMRCDKCQRPFLNRKKLASHQEQDCPHCKLCDRVMKNMHGLMLHQKTCVAKRETQKDAPTDESRLAQHIPGGRRSQPNRQIRPISSSDGEGMAKEFEHIDANEDSSRRTRNPAAMESTPTSAEFESITQHPHVGHEISHENVSNQFRCPKCDSKLGSNGALNNHKRLKTCQPCSICHKWFRLVDMRKHMNTAHTEHAHPFAGLEENQGSSQIALQSPSPETSDRRSAVACSIEGFASDEGSEEEEEVESDAELEDDNEDVQSESSISRRSEGGVIPQDDVSIHTERNNSTPSPDVEDDNLALATPEPDGMRPHSLASSSSNEEEPPQQETTDEALPKYSSISERTRSGSPQCLPFGHADGLDKSNYVSGLVPDSQSSSQASETIPQIAGTQDETGYKSKYFNEIVNEVGSKRLELDSRQRSDQATVQHSNRGAYGSENLNGQALRPSNETRWSKERDMNGNTIFLLNNVEASTSDVPTGSSHRSIQIPSNNILCPEPLRGQALMNGMSTHRKPNELTSEHFAGHRTFTPLHVPTGSSILRQETIYPRQDNSQAGNEYCPPSSQLEWTKIYNLDHNKEGQRLMLPVVNTSPTPYPPSTYQIVSGQSNILPAVNTHTAFNVPTASQTSSLDLLVFASSIESSRREGYHDDERKVSSQAPFDLDAEYETDNDEVNNSYPRNYSDDVANAGMRQTTPHQHQRYEGMQADTDAEFQLDDDKDSQEEEKVDVIPTNDTMTTLRSDPQYNQSNSHYIDISSDADAEGETDPEDAHVEDKADSQIEVPKGFRSGLPGIPSWFTFGGRSA